MTTKTKFITIAVLAALGLAVAAFIFMTPPVVAPGPQGNTGGDNPSVATSTPPTPSGITMAEVSKHSSSTDCWTAVRGTAYNLTTWISKHPGGQQAILKLCGKDGTSAFVGKHGGSSQQESVLATFKVGVIAQ